MANNPDDREAPLERLWNDYGLAIGALSATRNPLVQRLGQGLYDARPLLAALIELGNAHADALSTLIAKHEAKRG